MSIFDSNYCRLKMSEGTLAWSKRLISSLLSEGSSSSDDSDRGCEIGCLKIRDLRRSLLSFFMMSLPRILPVCVTVLILVVRTPN